MFVKIVAMNKKSSNTTNKVFLIVVNVSLLWVNYMEK